MMGATHKRKDILRIQIFLRSFYKQVYHLGIVYIPLIKRQTQSQVQEILHQKSRILKIQTLRRLQLNDLRTSRLLLKNNNNKNLYLETSLQLIPYQVTE